MALNDTAVTILRREFPALGRQVNGKPIIFLDGPGGTQVHGSVLQAMADYFINANGNAHGAFLYSRKTDEMTHRARVAARDFLGASMPEEIVFGPNMTTLTFRLSQAIGQTLVPGDEVVVTRLDHDANVSPWNALQKDGVNVRSVNFNPEDCTLDMVSLERAITSRTRLIALGYASNAVGTVNDVETVVQLGHRVGARVFVDAVHFAPHGPIDVSRLGCDFLVCSAYKFFGPHVGILYGRYELLDSLPALKVVPADDNPPGKFETGTNNFEGICGTLAAIQYLASVGERYGTEHFQSSHPVSPRRRILIGAMEAIRSYERELCRELIEGLQTIDGLETYGITDSTRLDQRVPTVSFASELFSPEHIAHRLDEENIFVWNGHFYAPSVVEGLRLQDRGGLVRIGLCHYNTLEEVGRLLDVLKKIHTR
jgi:cysteine desulfurase family protein (TIGR01976 family)